MTPQADDLTVAIANWATMAAAKITDAQKNVALSACMIMPDAEITVAVRLREGAVVLEGVYEGKRCELYREDVPPLRISTPFAATNMDVMQ